MESRIFHLQNLSALHVGTGQGVGVVDLPIARAKATNLPIVPGSALKGVLRDELATTLKNKDDLKALFGPESTQMDDTAHAGAVAFGDANLLILPVRSFAGTVAYATCPFILRQYQRDVGLKLYIPSLTDSAQVTKDSALLLQGNIALEDLDMSANAHEAADAWAAHIVSVLYPDSVNNATEWRTQVSQRFVILPDDIFSFLADTATEIRTRVQIVRETRIVKDGALWTEENLPADTVLWGVLGVAPSRKKDDKRSAADLAALLPIGETLIQVGGKHTIGRGQCRLLIAQQEA